MLKLVMAFVLASGAAVAAEPINGYREFVFGETPEQVRAKSKIELKPTEAIGVPGSALFPGVTAVVDTESRILDGETISIFYFHAGKLAEVRVVRRMQGSEIMRNEAFFAEAIDLLVQKYGPPGLRGADVYAKLDPEKRKAESETHFRWVQWESGENRLKVELDGVGMIFKYRTKTYDDWSGEQDRLRKLKDL